MGYLEGADLVSFQDVADIARQNWPRRGAKRFRRTRVLRLTRQSSAIASIQIKYFKNKDLFDIRIIGNHQSWARPMLGRRAQAANDEKTDHDHHSAREQTRARRLALDSVETNHC